MGTSCPSGRRPTCRAILILTSFVAVACADGMTSPGSEATESAEARTAPITICHVDVGGSYTVMTVPQAAAEAHLAHGDALGACVQRLLSPAEGEVLPQNNASAVCSPHPTRGSGLVIVFDWEESRDPKNLVAGYHLYAKNTNALNPIIDRVVGAPPFEYVNCNAFVAGHNLDGWQWTVRTVDVEGERGPASGPVDFSFEPCRLSDGTACFASDE